MLSNFNDILNQSNLKLFAQKLLWSLANEIEAVQGAFYITTKNDKEISVIKFIEGYAFHIAESAVLEYEFGDGIAGQVAKDGRAINIDNIPEGYLTVMSGLGNSSPNFLLAFPFKKDNEVIAVIEIASFKKIENEKLQLLESLSIDCTNKIIELKNSNPNE